MSLFNAVFQGPPTLANQSAGSHLAPNLGIDTANVVEYANVGNGWQAIPGSMVSKAFMLAQSANISTLLTYTVPGSMAGLYEVTFYDITTDTPTAGTLPGSSTAYTDLDTGVAATATTPVLATVNAANVPNSGSVTINAKAGTTITVSTTGYAAGSGTALTYNAKVRLTYLG
jgi:hypothetical protein